MTRSYHINPDWLVRPIEIWLLGVGGTGSEMLDILARMHVALKAVGHPSGFQLTAWDGDCVTASNIVRQRFWASDIGDNKASVSIQRLNLFMGLTWQACPQAYDPSKDQRTPPDLLISCVDSARTRANIAHAMMRQGDETDQEVLWLDMGNGHDTAQVCLGHLATGDRQTLWLPNIYQLHPELDTLTDDQTPSCSAADALSKQTFGINKTVAVSAGNLLWSLLTQPTIRYHGSYINSRDNMTQPMMIDPATWAVLDYHPSSLATHSPETPA